ncbi:MAG: thiol-disulfide isomerase [Bryobacteraceae bacterium]
MPILSRAFLSARYALALLCVLPVLAATGTIPTYNRDVAPILQNNCEGCHRAGEAAPMSLTSYKEVRPFAAAIKEAVTLRKMPPWFADPHYGKFSNDRSLSQHDIDTLVAWAKNGAPEGDAKDLPKPKEFVEGWNIGKPDLILEMPAAFTVPATGTVDYQYILIPGHFEKDTWVQMAEVRPDSRAVVHHIIAFVREPGSKWLASIKPGVPYVPTKEESDMSDAQFLVGFAPGTPPAVLPEGRAKLIPAGSDIIFQVHYTTNGKPATDKSRIGLMLAKAPVTERVLTLAATNDDFAIPPGHANYEVESEFEFGAEAKIVDLFPHMHLRGKDFKFTAVYPTGEAEELLSVPNYSFSWQLDYHPVTDITAPKGTKLKCVAHFDNSANNPYNPDPSKEVKWGDQSWDEMMIGFFNVAFPKDMDVSKLFVEKKKDEPATTAAMPAPKTPR